MLVVVDTGNVVGGVAANVTVIPEPVGLIVIVTDALFVESVTDVAVTVTVAGFGIVVGAVYVVAVPLGVEVAEKLPHVAGAVVVQVTVHFTPALALSFVTVALKLAVADVASDVGGVALKPTEITAGGGVLDPPPPPQPTNQTVIIATANSGTIRNIRGNT
jgi:uncharacterized membrane protein